MAQSIQSASDIKRDPTGNGRLNILEDGTLQSIAKNGTILDERQVGKEFYEKQSKQLQKAKAKKKPTGKEQSKNDIGPRFNCGAYICEEDPDCYPLNCSMCLTVNGYLGTCWNW